MDSLYTEVCVRKKATMGTFLIKVGLVVVVAALFLLAIVIGGMGIAGYIFSMVAAALVVALFVVLPRFTIDYEYIFCDGQIDFDQIIGGDRRKNKMKIDMDNIDVFAPETSHALDGYRNAPQLKVKDFSSGDISVKRFNIFLSDGTQKIKIVFEPSEKMIQFAKQKAPRKVFVE